MQKPLVIAYHLVWTAYGWWLPNDPRGSGSEVVRSPTLAKIGDPHYGRKIHQPADCEVRAFYWTVGGWKGFLDRPSVVRHVIAYAEKNPLEIRLPLQCWPFVTEYNDWPLHPGHSPNSPYARRLRGAC